MKLFASVLALLTVAATAFAASAGPLFQLTPGETVTVRVDNAGHWQVVDHGPAEKPTQDLPPVNEGVVRFTFYYTGYQPGMTLYVANGYDQRLEYHASIGRQPEDSLRPTTVCQVIAHLRGYEYWSYPIATVSVDDLRLVPETHAGLACQ